MGRPCDRAAGARGVHPHEPEADRPVQVAPVHQGEQAGHRDRLGERDDLHDVAQVAGERGEFGPVHVGQAVGRGDPPAPVPAQRGVLERAGGQAGTHHLAQVQGVALGRPVHLFHRGGFQRGTERAFQERGRLVHVERHEVDPLEEVVLPERPQRFGQRREVAAGEDEPRAVVAHEPRDVAGGQRVEQVRVVDPQHELPTLRPGRAAQEFLGRDGFRQVVAEHVAEPVRDRTERHRGTGGDRGDRHDQGCRVRRSSDHAVGHAGGDGGLPESGRTDERDAPPVIGDDRDGPVFLSAAEHRP
ncbi:hypothetical protein [Curtobacterium sp. MCJR17_043]|uniref:hypothetical protein n=1 Tax=Curtobacterium sp. MCJR17_043 TaxID=2175660 RepID=UPI0024DF643E|nr:hypothetical protein [Curtobacterium sp. MCJR17_043]WIB36559.1 hypothetical protein DEJ15_05425 [Curtobacterium sp. MCJR17_043]